MKFNLSNLTGLEQFQVKFIRVGSEFYATDKNDVKTLHITLAKENKVLDRIKELKSFEPDQLDGGLMFVSGKSVRIGSFSESLDIPMTDEARSQTLKMIEFRHPDWSVKKVSEV